MYVVVLSGKSVLCEDKTEVFGPYDSFEEAHAAGLKLHASCPFTVEYLEYKELRLDRVAEAS